MKEIDKEESEKNLNEFNKIVNFIKTLDDEGIEMFIKVAKNEGHNIGNENVFRETLKKLRSGS